MVCLWERTKAWLRLFSCRIATLNDWRKKGFGEEMFYQHQQECEPLCTFFHHLMKIIQTTNCEELDREIQNFKYIYIVYRDSIENDIYIKNAIKIQSIIYIYRSACMYISIYISTHHHTHPCYINVLCVLNFKWILGAKISPFLRKIYTTCLLP